MGYSKVPVGGKYKLRHLDRRIAKVQLDIRNLLFPVSPVSLVWLISVLCLLRSFSYPPYLVDCIDYVYDSLVPVFGRNVYTTLLSVVIVSFVLWYCVVQLVRRLFSLMLHYHGWMYESVGKPVSLPTKLFMTVIKFVNKSATFFSFQDLMPSMPLPSVDNTIRKYLESMKPLMSDAEYAETVRMADEFKSTLAPSLQRKLWLKWLTSPNYVSDWWKEVVYMRHRNSLLYTNVGCADVIAQKTTNVQAARAAVFILLRMQWTREIFVKQSMKPITVGGIPLCSAQYTDFFRTLRIPDETSDKMIRLNETRHIAVYCKGCWYKLNIYHGRRPLRFAELERSMQAIIDRTPDPVDGEPYLSALTAGKRDLWTKIRNNKFASGVNGESLSAIESAIDVIYLDDEERFYDENDPSKIEYEYGRTLHGNGYQLWCDRPSIFFISKNGRATCNGEHSVADALIFVHVREFIKYHEAFSRLYGPDGHCNGVVEVVPTAERLRWQLDDEVRSAIDDCYILAKGIADDFENSLLNFNDFGKDFIKKIGVSPDAFIQMALQLAYRRDLGKFALTYESAMARLFRDGRTETVRSCSLDSCAFVDAMLNPEITAKERLQLLKKACDYHQNSFRDAMTGKGCDRHLFALYVVTKYYNLQSPFLDKVFSAPFALSTSQTPQHQQSELMPLLNKAPDLFWPAGAFPCPEGSDYGVCYTIGAAGDVFSFHISSWKSLKHTNTSRFREQLASCLREMKLVCEQAMKK